MAPAEEPVPGPAPAPGGVPRTVPVVAFPPLSRSACVVVYVAVQSMLSPGASTVFGQLIPVRSGCTHATPVSVTVPVLAIVIPTASVCPAWSKLSGLTNPPVIAMPFDTWAGTVADDGSDTVAVVAPGAVPCAVAEFVTAPASSSACVVVYVAVQAVVSPGASVVDGQVTADRPGRSVSL